MNIELFEKIQIKGKNLKLLDLGCGSGIFSSVVTLNNGNIASIDYSDIEEEAIEVCKRNFLNLKDQFLETELISNYYVSDMYKRIPEGMKYDVILINMPQMPGKVPFRGFNSINSVDRYGGYDGSDYNFRAINEMKNYLSSEGEAYMLYL